MTDQDDEAMRVWRHANRASLTANNKQGGAMGAAAAVIRAALDKARWEALEEAANIVGKAMTEADINGRDEVSEELYAVQCAIYNSAGGKHGAD